VTRHWTELILRLFGQRTRRHSRLEAYAAPGSATFREHRTRVRPAHTSRHNIDHDCRQPTAGRE